MSTQKRPVLTLTRSATAVLLKYQLVTVLGAVATAGAAAFGAVVTDAAVGDDIAVDVLGSTTLIASANIADGARVQVAANGQAVTATTGIPVAIALQDAVAGEPFEALLLPGASAPAA